MKNSLLQQEKERKAQIEKSWIHQGKIVKMHLESIFYNDGTKKNVEIVEHPGAVVILPVTSNKNIIFIKQYRKAVDKILIELPAGILEKGEKPSTCAKRELQEEIGYKPNKLINLGGFHPSPGFCSQLPPPKGGGLPKTSC